MQSGRAGLESPPFAPNCRLSRLRRPCGRLSPSTKGADLNWIDIAFLVVLVFGAIIGLRTGVIGAAVIAVGVVAGWYIAGACFAQRRRLFRPRSDHRHRNHHPALPSVDGGGTDARRNRGKVGEAALCGRDARHIDDCRPYRRRGRGPADRLYPGVGPAPRTRPRNLRHRAAQRGCGGRRGRQDSRSRGDPDRGRRLGRRLFRRAPPWSGCTPTFRATRSA